MTYSNIMSICCVVGILQFSSTHAQVAAKESPTTNTILPSVPFRYVLIDANNPRHPHNNTIGDINGDGYLDALEASGDGFRDGLFWWKYPLWTKTLIDTGSFSTDMQVGDIDGDGDLDVVVTRGIDYGISVWWYENPRPAGNPESDPWIRHFVANATTHDVELADIDNDGKLDIIVRNNTLIIFFQEPGITWRSVILSQRPWEGTAIGDIDGDSDLDVAINGYWFQNPLPLGDPRFDAWTERVIDTNWPSSVGVHIRDINLDGKNDILLAPSASFYGRLSWYETVNPLTGPWVEHIIDPSVNCIHTFKTADMDLNGTIDVVTASGHYCGQAGDPHWISVYLNSGNGLSWTTQRVASTGLHNLRIGDIGSDGDIDIIGSNAHNVNNSHGSPLEMWENTIFDGIGPPIVGTEPLNQEALVGQTATFSVTVVGSQLVYKWQKNSIDIAGTDSSSYSTPPVTLSDNGSLYRCIISNSFGADTTVQAALTVTTGRVTNGLQVLYGFEEGSGAIVNDVSGVGSPINLTIGNTANVAWGQNFLSVNSSTILTSAANATKVIDACKLTNEITIEAWIKPVTTSQNGPARIVTISADGSFRNFTLGQGISGGSSNVYDLRLRTTTTNSNGTMSPSFSTAAGSLTAQLTHVVVTRQAAGTTKIYINGTESLSGTVGGNFSTWSNYKLAMANEQTNDRPWLGEYHLVAIYSRALTSFEVNHNFSVGPVWYQSVYANLKLLLQGPYVGSGVSLKTSLGSLLPLTHPYNTSPWNYTGTEHVDTIPPNVVDWVLVELRTGTAANTKVAIRAAFIKSDGSITDLDGTNLLSFKVAAPGNFYVVVRHRNHLGIMSSSAITLNSNSQLYDFSTANSKSYGTNAQTQVGPGRFALYGGDVNASGVIDVVDANVVFAAWIQTGYSLNDVNLSSIVNALDAHIIFGNLNKVTQVPQ